MIIFSNRRTHRAQHFIGSALVLGSLALAACGGGSSGTTDPDPNPNPNPNPNTQNVIITIISKSIDLEADHGQLYTYIGDAAVTRAQMPTLLNENAPTLRLNPGATQGTVTVSVPKGKVLTIFAVEFGTNGFAVEQPPTPIPTRAPRDQIEFKSFEGQFSPVETGVVAVTADVAKTITANFDRVGGLVYQIAGCTTHLVQNTNVVGLLSFGTTIKDPAPDLTTFNGFSGVLNGKPSVQRDYLYIWGKQGSIVTFRARFRDDRAAMQSGFIRWDGSASICGTSLLCQITVPARSNAIAPARMVNGYSIINGTTEGCGCLSPTNCTMFP